MEQIVFDGQQDGEKILYIIREHPLTVYVSYLTVILVGICISAIAFVISRSYMYTGQIIAFGGLVFGIIVALVGSYWIKRHHEKTIAYITDRRIMRFEAINPFVTAKRALFWNEALKAKAYSVNLFWKLLNIGTLSIETQVPEQGDVRIDHVYYADDLENYIDKLLYIYKNTPADITSVKPFVPKPKGKRDA